MAKRKTVKKKQTAKMMGKKTATKTKAGARSVSARKTSAPRSTRKPARRAKPDTGLRLASASPSLTVDNAAATLSWYCDVLGFAIADRWEREGTLMGGELRAGDVTLYVGQDDWKKGRDRVKGEGVRVYLTTDQDIDRLAAGIKSRGGTLASEPKDEWGVRAFSLEDPTGYKITISSER